MSYRRRLPEVVCNQSYVWASRERGREYSRRGPLVGLRDETGGRSREVGDTKGGRSIITVSVRGRRTEGSPERGYKSNNEVIISYRCLEWKLEASVIDHRPFCSFTTSSSSRHPSLHRTRQPLLSPTLSSLL